MAGLIQINDSAAAGPRKAVRRDLIEVNGNDFANLRMAEPHELAGDWIMAVDGKHCRLRFGSARVEAMNAYALTIADATCLNGSIDPTPAGWRPAPDGIELAGADRLTVALFVDGGGRFGVAKLANGGEARLWRV